MYFYEKAGLMENYIDAVLEKFVAFPSFFNDLPDSYFYGELVTQFHMENQIGGLLAKSAGKAHM